MLAQYKRNVIVSFSLQSDTTLLSLEQCDISVAFFIFAKRCFPLSAPDYRLLQKVAVACVKIVFDKVVVGVPSTLFSAAHKIIFALHPIGGATIDNRRVVVITSNAEVQTVRERFATVVGRRKELFRAMRLHGADTTSKSRVGEWELLVTFRSRKVTFHTAPQCRNT